MKKTLGLTALAFAITIFALETHSAHADCNTCNGYNSYSNYNYGAYYGSFPDADYYNRVNPAPNYRYAPSSGYDYQSYYRPYYDSGYTYRGYRPTSPVYNSPNYRSNYYGSAGYGSQFNFYNPGLIGN